MSSSFLSNGKRWFAHTSSPLIVLLVLGASNLAQASSTVSSTVVKDWESQWMSSEPGFKLDLSYDYANETTLMYNNNSASDAFVRSRYASTQEIEGYTQSQTYSATLVYSREKWMLAAIVPQVIRDHGTFGEDPFNYPSLGSSYTTTTDSGLGDVKVMGRYFGFSSEKKWGLIAGIKFATGNNSNYYHAGTNSNSPLDPGVQIGTGSTDLIYGAFTGGIIGNHDWFVQGTIQHAFATRSAIGGLDYRPGDIYAVHAGMHYNGYGDKATPMLQLNMLKRDSDTGNWAVINGQFVSAIAVDPITGAADSGGLFAYLTPGVSTKFKGGSSAYAFIQIPVYRNVSALQLAPSYVLTLGWNDSF